MYNQFKLLARRRFLPLFMTQYLGAFNDNVFKNALVILITYATAQELGADPAVLVTAAAGIFILPFFLFSAIAGQIADKYEKPFLIRRLKAIEIILMITAAAGFYIGNIYFLLFVLFLMGTQSSFFGPLKYSILPDLLDREELIGGNALVEAATFIAILLGTIMGGIFILKDGGITIISITVLVVAVCGWISSRYIPALPTQSKTVPVNLNIFSASWSILKKLRPQRDVFNAILGISWFWLVGFLFLAYLPVYGQSILNVNEDVVTMMLTFFSVGIGIGSLLCNRILKGEIKMSLAPLGAAGMGITTLLLYMYQPSVVAVDQYLGVQDFFAMPSGFLVLAIMTAVAAFGGIYVVPLYAVLQTRIDDEYRSRAIAANNIMNAFFMVAASIVALVLLKYLSSIAELFAILGLINFVVAALFLRGRS